MGKYSVVTKERRAQIQERKRTLHGDPATGKLKQRVPPVSISGKRKRKLFKKWRREQKDALQKGLVTMQDVEMAVTEGASEGTNEKSQKKFHLKKSAKLRIKKFKGKGKDKRKPSKSTAADAPVEAMVE